MKNTLITAFTALAITCATAQAGHHHGPPHRDLFAVLDVISVVNDVCRTAAIVNASTKPVEVRTTSTYVQPVQPTYVQPTTTYVQPMTPFGPTTVVQPVTTYVQPSTVVQPVVTTPTVVQPVVTAPTVVQPTVTTSTVVQPVVTSPTVIYGSGYYYPSTHWYRGSHYHHHPAPPPVVRPAPAPHHPGFRPGPGLPPPRH